MRRRFFVQQFADNRAVIQGEAAHHLGRVLRAKEGQLYELSDGQQVWLGRIDVAVQDRIEFTLIDKIPAAKPNLETTLLLSIVKFDAFEWALEKGTELGMSAIVPLAAGRSEKALVSAARKRAGRWNKILLEASQQSRRLGVPMLGEVARPKQAFSGSNAEMKIILSERKDAPSLREVLSGIAAPAAVALAIGPAGGWTDEEFAAAQASGFREASLGKLILRAETAVVAVLASLNYALEQ